MAKGVKSGGRKKGTPNKATAEMREAFRLVFERRLKDLDRWIRETGDGYEEQQHLSNGVVVTRIVKNPGKAAELLVRIAEFHIAKARQELELTASEGMSLVVTYAGEKTHGNGI